MTFKSLIQALGAFPKDKVSFLPFFKKVTLEDLGFYAEDVHAMKYFEDSNYPLVNHAFMLENALHQTKFVAGSAVQSEAGFFPFPWKNTRHDVVGCSTLCSSDHATLCWFVVPPGGVLPLHDHPAMHVWQRILYGKLKVTSFDWLPPPTDDPNFPADLTDMVKLAAARAQYGGEAVVTSSRVIEGNESAQDSVKGGEAEVLSFTAAGGGGVLHELENMDSETPALFLDVISPPYLKAPDFLDCTYYSAVPSKDSEKTGSSGRVVKGNQDAGVTCKLAKGDRVWLEPRKDYPGPDMNAFVHISND